VGHFLLLLAQNVDRLAANALGYGSAFSDSSGLVGANALPHPDFGFDCCCGRKPAHFIADKDYTVAALCPFSTCWKATIPPMVKIAKMKLSCQFDTMKNKTQPVCHHLRETFSLCYAGFYPLGFLSFISKPVGTTQRIQLKFGTNRTLENHVG